MTSDFRWPYIAGATVTGPRHLANGTAGQDAWAYSRIDDICIIGVSDGVSSACFGGEGAKTLVSAIIDGPVSFSRDGLVSLITAAREKVINLSCSHGNNPEDYAATLLVLLYQNGQIIAGQVGDGLILIKNHGKYVPLIPEKEKQAEYVNETASIMSPKWESDLTIYCESAQTAIISTDGSEGLLVTREQTGYDPYYPFLDPFVEFLNNSPDLERDGNAAIETLLLSKKVVEFSTDDKTLVFISEKLK